MLKYFRRIFLFIVDIFISLIRYGDDDDDDNNDDDDDDDDDISFLTF